MARVLFLEPPLTPISFPALASPTSLLVPSASVSPVSSLSPSEPWVLPVLCLCLCFSWLLECAGGLIGVDVNAGDLLPGAHAGIQAQKVLLLGLSASHSGPVNARNQRALFHPKAPPHPIHQETHSSHLENPNLRVHLSLPSRWITSGEHVHTGGVRRRRGGILLAPVGAEERGSCSSQDSLAWWGRGCMRITAEQPLSSR